MKLSYSFLVVCVSQLSSTSVSDENREHAIIVRRLLYLICWNLVHRTAGGGQRIWQSLGRSSPRERDILFAFHGTTGFIRKSVLSIALLLGSVLPGWNILNQPAGRKLGFSEICHEFRLPSIHPRSLLRLLPLTISLLPEGPRRTFLRKFLLMKLFGSGC